ncbi:MAG: hypothetical protein F9K18_05715, partial [Thermoanaerobaculia bacterium]
MRRAGGRTGRWRRAATRATAPLALLALLGAATPAGAGRISLETRAECVAVPAVARCSVEIENRGDEAARELAVTLETPGFESSRRALEELRPGALWRGGFELDPSAVPAGRTAVVVLASYQDEGGYPLSAVAHAYLEKAAPARPAWRASLASVSVRDREVETVLRVEGAGAVSASPSARLVLPRELEAAGPRTVALRPGAGGRLEARFAVANGSAFAGSTYRIYAVLEREHAGVRESLFVPATVTVLGAPPPTAIFRLPLLAASGLLAALLVSGVTRSLRRDAAVDGARVLHEQAGWLLDFGVLAAIFAYLLGYLRPELLLAPTTTTGGDTASHFLTARYLVENLLPEGRVLGWMPGNLAGYPVFQLYFPLPFLLIAGISYGAGLQVAFKLVTVLGTFLTPIAAYAAFRCLGLRRPAPALAAVFTVPFLMIESNSVWGGNLPSTLSGEFAYSLALALTLLFVGTSYRGLAEGRFLIANAVLLALVALTHAYALLLAGCLSAAHLLWLPRRRRNLGYLARLYALAFSLIGFWIVPLLAYSGYTSPYRDVWRIHSWREVLPPILWPLALAVLAGLSFVGVRAARRGPGHPFRIDPRLAALGGGLWVGLVLYRLAPWLGVVDIRFLPIVQLTIALAAAPAVAALARRLRPAAAGVALVVLATFAWADRQVTYIPSWIEWNYSGFERRPLWSAFSAVNRHLAGGIEEPRVVFEHSPAHNAAGSIRAFESLPLFSGRSTLEGLYVQSSLNSPPIFYLQSELSEVASCPFPDFHCSRPDLSRAAEHLRRYNAGQVVARSSSLKAALRASGDFSLESEIPPYEVHRVRGNAGRYVIPLEHEPVRVASEDWKRDFYRWFKRPDADGVVLVASSRSEARDRARFRLAFETLPARVPRIGLPASEVEVEEEIDEHRIVIRTSRPGHPLLVRVSYHPRWRSTGGERIHLASPGFMLLFPETREVTLEFGDPPLVRFGHLLTALGCAIVATAALRGVRRRPRRSAAMPDPAPAPASGWRACGGPAVAFALTLATWAATGAGEGSY